MHIPGQFLEKTSTRILAIALGIIALFLVFLFAFIFPVVQDALFDSRKMAAKNLVDSVCSMLKDYSARVERGDIGSFEARNEAMERIRTMRFKDHGYIWINDTTSPYPVMIMHPVQPSLEGKIMDDDFYRTAVAVQPGMDAREVQFENEKRHFFKVFLEVAENHGKGFVEYQWYRPTASGMTERIYPKKSYVKLFEPWGWIIGTGIYIEDVYAEMNRLKWTIISMAAAIFLLALAGTMFLMRTITEPINQLVWFAEKVAGGSLNARIRGRFRGEMGQLKQAISRMVDELRSRMREAEQRAREAEAAHRALKNSEEKYRQIFENAPLGVVHFDKNGVITACNDTFVEGIGSSRQDLVGMDMLGLPDEKIVQAVNAALGGRLGFYEGVYHSVTGGKSTPVRALFAPFRDSRGDIAGGVGMVEDITERKKEEDALRESEEKYCILVENAKEAIFVAQDGMLRFANRAACELTGHGYEMLTSVPFADFLHPEDREFVLDRHYKRLKGIETESDYCFRVVNSSGDLRWVDLSSVEIQWEGRPATLNFVSDITDQKRAEQEREKLEKQLRQSQKIEALGTLTGGVAHDFNNILSIIMGYTELVRSELDENHPAQKGLAEISSAGARARDVVRQLLAFSRRGEEDKSAQNIGLIIKEAMRMIRSTTPSLIDIDEQIRTDLPMILANPTQVHQLLINLCKNASDAMSEKGGVMTVRLESVTLEQNIPAFGFDLAPGDYVKLTVGDTGHGIGADRLERIFDPYFTTKEVDKGTGLGLSVVLGIVRDLGGGVKVESKAGKGSSFEVFFPVLWHWQDSEESREGGDLPTGTERILFVDDEAPVAQLSEIRLRKLGYEPDCQTDPENALKRFAGAPDSFDLVITDMTMPKMTGEMLAKEILRLRPDMKIILCTGYSDKISEESLREAGIARYLGKPVELAELARVIREVLDG